MSLTACKPDHYTSLTPTTHTCIVCGVSVESEPQQAFDSTTGKEITVYSPGSRYYALEGVLCGPDCALKKHQEF